MLFDRTRLFARRLLALLICTLMVLSLLPAPAIAATFEDINYDDVWNPHTMDDGGYCVLSANAMMLRRAALMNGDPNWANITYKKLAASKAVVTDPSARVPATRWSYTYQDISVKRTTLTGTTAEKEQKLIALLRAHPEGIALYTSSHTVLLTDYTDGVFYCCETHPYLFHGRMPLSEANCSVAAASAYWYVTSSVEPLEPSVPLTSVSFDQQQVTILLGQTVRLKPTVTPANTTVRESFWSSETPWVASVDQTGRVTGERIGESVIYFEMGDLSASCTVTVVPVPVKTVSLDSPAITIDQGDTVMLRASYKPGNATYPYMEWQNGDDSVATIDPENENGTTAWLYAEAPGTTVVTVVAEGTNAYSQCVVTVRPRPEDGISMHRLYNPWTGEHFYTASVNERDGLIEAGWRYEGIAWTAPEDSGTPVYRLYNPWSYDHHYCTSAEERDELAAVGWRFEGIGWYSADEGGVAMLRQYNPFAATGTHNYTADTSENDSLVSLGWRPEGVGWYGLLLDENSRVVVTAPTVEEEPAPAEEEPLVEEEPLAEEPVPAEEEPLMEEPVPAEEEPLAEEPASADPAI